MGNLADKNRCHLFQKVLFQKKWRNVSQVYMKVAVKMEVVMGECYQYHFVKGLMTSVRMCLQYHKCYFYWLQQKMNHWFCEWCGCVCLVIIGRSQVVNLLKFTSRLITCQKHSWRLGYMTTRLAVCTPSDT